MDKRQQWIIVAIVILAMLVIGAVVYRQYAAVPTLPTSLGSYADQASRKGPEAPTTVATEADPIPTGELSPDDVAKGIGADLGKEESSVKDETTTEKTGATEKASTLNDYGNTYDENSL